MAPGTTLTRPRPAGPSSSKPASSIAIDRVRCRRISASARARPRPWTRSSGCCWRRPGTRWRMPAIAPIRLAGGRVGVFVGICTNDYGLPAAARRDPSDRRLCRPPAPHPASPPAGSPTRWASPARRWRSTPPARPRWSRCTWRSRRCAPASATWRWPAASTSCSRPGLGRRSSSGAQMLAPDGRCKPFDAARRRLRPRRGLRRGGPASGWPTRARGDRVRAVIRGSAVNQDGRSRRPDRALGPGAGGGDPRGAGRCRPGARRRSTRSRRTAPARRLGDPIEMHALAERVRRARRGRCGWARSRPISAMPRPPPGWPG